MEFLFNALLSIGVFLLDWWVPLALLAIMILAAWMVCSEWRSAPLDPSVPFTAEELAAPLGEDVKAPLDPSVPFTAEELAAPLGEDVKALLAKWCQDHDVLEDIRLALDKVLSEEEEQA